VTLELLLQGGLGNQLFQGLAALNIAKLTDQELVINCHWYRRQPESRHEVNGFRVYELENHPLFSGYRLSYKSRKLVRKAYDLKLPSLHKELRLVSDYSNDPSIFSQIHPRFVSGYFQTKQLLDATNINLTDILNLGVYAKIFLTYMQEIQETESIGIHLRLGDYLQDNNFKLISSNYVQIALYEAFKDLSKTTKLYVFSDSIDLIYDFFPQIKNFDHILVDPVLFTGMETIHLMAQCQKLILSHSTFSWWAGVLATEKGNTVYAPLNEGRTVSSGNFGPELAISTWIGISNRPDEIGGVVGNGKPKSHH
jgi:hypothetical protein